MTDFLKRLACWRADQVHSAFNPVEATVDFIGLGREPGHVRVKFSELTLNRADTQLQIADVVKDAIYLGVHAFQQLKRVTGNVVVHVRLQAFARTIAHKVKDGEARWFSDAYLDAEEAA